MKIRIFEIEIDEKDMDLNDISDMLLDDELDIHKDWLDELWGKAAFENVYPDDMMGSEGDE